MHVFLNLKFNKKRSRTIGGGNGSAICNDAIRIWEFGTVPKMFFVANEETLLLRCMTMIMVGSFCSVGEICMYIRKPLNA